MKKTDPQKETLKRIARTEAYAEKVRQEFAKTVNAILALNKTLPTLEDGVMFSFDAESMAKQKQVEGLLRQLHSAAVLAIKKGINAEWQQANIECDELVKSYFGKVVLSQPRFAAWLNRNTAALEAFLKRSDNGLNLSDRVWQSVRQLRDEMEVAMTVAIGEGDSAASMSRKVRQYLNDPDLMFRRFRYKDENGNWQRKWKKRIKDDYTGKYRWIDYDKDSYKVGAGVYKSSAKNAMRVARTETNIAYRRADHERWQQMDFVLGQKIHLSRSHPVVDICDELQGDYPKDFVFDGWHPQCFCFVTPILMDKSEMSKMTDAFLKGEEYTPKGKQISDYPQGFKDWVTKHSEQITASRVKGTEPYFVKNNAAVIDNILGQKTKEFTTIEKAKLRHDERTPEQIADIKERIEIRRISMELGLNPYEHTPEALKCMQMENANKARELYEDNGKKTDVRLSWPMSVNKDKKCYTRDIVEYRTRFGAKIIKPIDLLKSKQNYSVNDAAQNMEALPIELKATIDELILLDYRNPADSYWSTKYKMKNFRSWATGGNGRITFYSNESWEVQGNPIFDTLCHECGHNIDGKLNRLSESKIWSDAMSKDFSFNKTKSSPTEYGKVHVHEDFAESIKYYLINKENFRKEFPNRFIVIKAILERFD